KKRSSVTSYSRLSLSVYRATLPAAPQRFRLASAAARWAWAAALSSSQTAMRSMGSPRFLSVLYSLLAARSIGAARFFARVLLRRGGAGVIISSCRGVMQNKEHYANTKNKPVAGPVSDRIYRGAAGLHRLYFS